MLSRLLLETVQRCGNMIHPLVGGFKVVPEVSAVFVQPLQFLGKPLPGLVVALATHPGSQSRGSTKATPHNPRYPEAFTCRPQDKIQDLLVAQELLNAEKEQEVSAIPFPWPFGLQLLLRTLLACQQ